MTKQSGSIHPWHAHIRDHHVEVGRLAVADRVFTPCGEMNFPTPSVAVKHPPHSI
jgi:hypothetical protein